MSRMWITRRRTIALLVPVALLALAALVAAPTFADEGRGFKADLSGYEETPVTLSTPGHGAFKAMVSGDGASISYELSYGDLESAAFAAHIHLGMPATTGGVIAFLCGGGGKPDCPPTGGTVTGMIVAADVIGPAGQGIAAGEFEELLAAMRVGATYANVHTSTRPGGEIRGLIR